MDSLRILVADDSQFMRIAYKKILETQINYEVVGMAADGAEACQLALDLSPDVAILDVRMPRLSGLEAAHHIKSHRPKTAIVMISGFDDLSFVAELIKDGPEGKAYLLKTSLDDVGELIRVVKAVTRGQTVLDHVLVQKLVRRLASQPKTSLTRLTEIERNILGLMAEGYDDSSIALNLHLDELAVEDYVSSIYYELGLAKEVGKDRRVQAVLMFFNQCSPAPHNPQFEQKGSTI